MALPTNATENIEVKSDAYPGRVYYLKPAMVMDRTRLARLRLPGVRRSQQLLTKMSERVLESDLSGRFDSSQCNLINELFHQSLNADGLNLNQLEPEEMELLIEAENYLGEIDPVYQKMMDDSQEARTQADAARLAYLLVEIEEKGETFKPEGQAKTEEWLMTLRGVDFEKLLRASEDAAELTATASKNSEPPPTSD